MRIAIDAREISVARPGGLRSYAESIIDSLSGYVDGSNRLDMSIYLDRPISRCSGLTECDFRVCPPSQLVLREQIYLPRRLRDDGAHLCHFPANTAALRCPVPYVLTLHDTFCMERSLVDTLSKGSAHRKALSLYSKVVPFWAARRARKIVTVSCYSASRIAKLLRIDSRDIAVIPQAIRSPVSAGGCRRLRAPC